MSSRGKALLLGLAAASFALYACQVLVGVTDDEGTPRPPPGVTGDPCVHYEPPRPPQGAPDAPDLPPLWFAMTNLEGLPRPDGRAVGFDLDGRCTGFPSSTAFDGGPPCARLVIDGLGGVDNAAASLFGALPFGYGKSSFDAFQTTARTGGRTLLVYLAKYSGQPNDPSVQARIVASEALQSNVCSGEKTVDGGTRADGCDTWGYPPAAFGADGGGPAPVLHEGYVVDGRLVVTVRANEPLDVSLNGLFSLPLTGAVLVARLGEKAGPSGAAVRTLSGTLAGRISASSFLSAVARNPALCVPGPLEAFKNVVCDYRDMPSSLTDDPAKACTDISVGLSFQSVQAKLGTPIPPAPLAPACDAGTPTCD